MYVYIYIYSYYCSEKKSVRVQWDAIIPSDFPWELQPIMSRACRIPAPRPRWVDNVHKYHTPSRRSRNQAICCLKENITKYNPFGKSQSNSTELRIRINTAWNALNRLSLAWSAQDRRSANSGCASPEHTARSVRPRDLCKAKVPNPRSEKRKGDLTPVKLLRYWGNVSVIDVCVRMYTYCILIYLQYLTIISTSFIQVRAMIYIQKSLKHPKATWRGSGPTGNNFLNWGTTGGPPHFVQPNEDHSW